MEELKQLYEIFNHPFFIVVGGFFTIASLLIVILNIYFWILGITPLLLRLGYGRWSRKIAIVADLDSYNILKKDLVDSGVFREKNISHPITPASISDVKDHNLLLVDYKSFNEDQIKRILDNKSSKSGMIFYSSPVGGERISDEIMSLIGNTSNTTIVNFRGRLLNDIIITLITTSYEKR